MDQQKIWHSGKIWICFMAKIQETLNLTNFAFISQKKNLFLLLTRETHTSFETLEFPLFSVLYLLAVKITRASPFFDGVKNFAAVFSSNFLIYVSQCNPSWSLELIFRNKRNSKYPLKYMVCGRMFNKCAFYCRKQMDNSICCNNTTEEN